MAVKSRWRLFVDTKGLCRVCETNHHVSRVLPRTLLLPPAHYLDQGDAQQKGATNQVTSPFLVRDAEGRKFWLDSVNGGKEVFSGIFDNIHQKKLNVKKDLEEACSAQSVEGLEDAVSVNAKKCQQNEDCEKLISRPVLTGGSKLLCVPNFAAIDKKVAAEPKPADKDVTVRLRRERCVCVCVCVCVWLCVCGCWESERRSEVVVVVVVVKVVVGGRSVGG